ncbi:MAG: hypothetical protein KDB80_04140 [Planctomycetes bacterium]|nr:hypothetical protein [Planctomycetota bacterium]
MLCMGVTSTIAGLAGHALASQGVFVLVEPLASRVPSDRHVAFIATGWAHSASYLAGFVGGLVLMQRIWKARQAAARRAAV